ncbi:MAG: glycosyltransferase [Gammaproteobacteria bacterium]
MHVAFVVSSFPAVSHTFIDSQIRGLLKLGHRVSVHAFSRPGPGLTHAYWTDLDHPLEVYYGAPQPKIGWRRLAEAGLRFPNFLRHPGVWLRGLLDAPHHPFARRLDPLYWSLPLLSAVRADVWVCHFGDVALRALAVNRLVHPGEERTCRLAVFFHGADITRFVDEHGPGVYSQLLSETDLCLPISARWQQRLLELGAQPERINLHRMGVDCDRYAFLPRSLPDHGPLQLLSVARLVEKKGLEYAIRAIALLPPDLRARVRYDIIGDGPLQDELQALIDTMKLQDQITLLGWQDQTEIVEHVTAAHLMLVPSVTAQDGDQEGIPVSAMEAMATGLPVMATWHSGIPELVHDRKNGRLADERDGGWPGRGDCRDPEQPRRLCPPCRRCQNHRRGRFQRSPAQCGAGEKLLRLIA